MDQDFDLSSLGKRRLSSDLIALYSFLKRQRRERLDLFSLVPSDRTHGNGSKLHQERSRLHIKKHLFIKGVVKSRNRLHREAVGVKNLSVFKRHLENAYNNML